MKLTITLKDECGNSWGVRTIGAAEAPHVIHAVDPNTRVFVRTVEEQEAAQVATELVEDIKNACVIIMQEAETEDEAA